MLEGLCQKKIKIREVVLQMKKDEKKVNTESALARKLAKILGFGTDDFNRNVKKLSDKINSSLPKNMRPINPPVIKSWIFTKKYPLRKNLVVLAKAIEIDPDVLIAREDHVAEDYPPVANLGNEIIKTLDTAFEKLLPYLQGKYIKVDDLEPEKLEIINEIIKIKGQAGINLLKYSIDAIHKIKQDIIDDKKKENNSNDN